MPDPGPFGETFFEASDRAMVPASFVNSPFGGNVDSVLTFATQRLPDLDFEGCDFLRCVFGISNSECW